ncbi:MAG: hypothetical protein AAGI11_04260 [Pseudomonadota bacterium]
MKLLLILAIVAVALAPLLHFLPSKRQKQQAAMREKAALAGLFVEFRNLPEVGNSAQMPQPPKGSVIYYAKRLPPSRSREMRRGAWLRRGEMWQGLTAGSGLPPALARLPESIMAVSLEEGSCGVYWQEQGELEDVDVIATSVNNWSEQL